MISIIDKSNQNGAVYLRGLSTDTKPTTTMSVGIGDIYIANGSSYEEIDTGDKYMYDADSNQWIMVYSAS